MFLTPPSPSRTKFFGKLSNATAPPSQQPPTPRQHLPPSSTSHNSTTTTTNNLPPLQPSTTRQMTSSHRGLEHGLPPGTILPDPMRAPQLRPSSHESHAAQPTHRATASYDRDEYPPQQHWQQQQQQQQPQARQSDQVRSEDQRSRQEEDKRRQEELKLQQEEVRLEQRRVEQEMLRESIAKGIHPNLVPLIFLGLGAAGSSSNGGFEMAQQYIQQFQQVGLQVQNQLQYVAPDVRREYRAAPAAPLQYGALQQASPASTAPPPGHTAAAVAAVYPSPAYQSPKDHIRSLAAQSSRFGPTQAVAANSPGSSSLPRLTTNEAQVQAGLPGNPPSAHGPPPGASNRTSPSPSIYFHHWQPPQTANSSQKTSPKHSSHLSSTETHHSSPRKRKATGSHQPAPPPRSGTQRSVSPSRSVTSTSGKRRGRRRSSDASVTLQHSPRVMSKDRDGAREGRDYESQADSQPASMPTSGEMETKGEIQRSHPNSGSMEDVGRDS